MVEKTDFKYGKDFDDIDIEHLARKYHEICKEMVNKQIGMITKPTQPYIEWDNLTDDQKNGRRFIARKLLENYKILDYDSWIDNQYN